MRLSKKREEDEENLYKIMEENNKLQDELKQMMTKKHVSQISGSREENRHSETVQKRDTTLTFGGEANYAKTYKQAAHEGPAKSRIGSIEDERLRDTIDALEFMKKREKSLQEEVRHLSQIISK